MHDSEEYMAVYCLRDSILIRMGQRYLIVYRSSSYECMIVSFSCYLPVSTCTGLHECMHAILGHLCYKDDSYTILLSCNQGSAVSHRKSRKFLCGIQSNPSLV